MLIEDMIDLGDEHGDDKTGLGQQICPTHCFHAKQDPQFGLLWAKGPHSFNNSYHPQF